MSSGLITSLKSIYPNARITWLAEPIGKPMLQEHPMLDEVIELPRQKWKALRKDQGTMSFLKEIWQMRRMLKDKNFDLVLDTQGLLKSGIWAWMTGAKKRIGLGSKEGSQYFMTEVLQRDASPIIGSEYKTLANYLGAEDEAYKMGISESDDYKKNVTALLNQFELSNFVVFCPYTTRPQKHWFDHHWQELAQKIQLQFGLPCVVLGGPDDKEQAQKLVGDGTSNMINLVGQTRLPETAELISRAQFVVGVDTGITHMGIMHQVPTICIFGSTAPYLSADNATILYLNMHCSPCRRKPTCGGQFDCLRDITPDMVISAMSDLQ